MSYPDGHNPPDHILEEFLEMSHRSTGGIAVHCMAGLGRTGTLICAYMIKHYDFTAAESIGYSRFCRPGFVVGPQQLYLECFENVIFGAKKTNTRAYSSPTPSRHLKERQEEEGSHTPQPRKLDGKVRGLETAGEMVPFLF